MWNWILIFLELKLTEHEKTILKAVDKKQKHLAEYGGRIVVSKRGAIRDEFETDAGRVAYYKSLRGKVDVED